MTDYDKSVFLGEGTYGKVKKTGSVATKSFVLLHSLIQEYAAGRYLFDCDRVVKVLEVDFNHQTIKMELFQGSARKWNPSDKSIQQKMHFVRETIKGLICLHDLGIVHGDLNPGNILVNWNSKGDITKLVMGDLGFVAPKRYSKVRYTAPLYRDENFEPTFEHDIYSLGVIMVELFGDSIPRKVRKHPKDKVKYVLEDIIPYAKKIKDQKLRELTFRMISNDKSERPTARYLLVHLFDERVELMTHPGFPKRSNPDGIITSEKQSNLIKIFRTYSEMVSSEQSELVPEKVSKDQSVQRSTSDKKRNELKFEIKRTKLGYLACMNHIIDHKISSNNHIVYVAATLMILSSIFGELGFGIEEAKLLAKSSDRTIFKALEELLNSSKFLKSIFYTNAACF